NVTSPDIVNGVAKRACEFPPYLNAGCFRCWLTMTLAAPSAPVSALMHLSSPHTCATSCAIGLPSRSTTFPLTTPMFSSAPLPFTPGAGQLLVDPPAPLLPPVAPTDVLTPFAVDEAPDDEVEPP